MIKVGKKRLVIFAAILAIGSSISSYAAEVSVVAIDGSQPLTQEELAQIYSGVETATDMDFQYPGRGFAYDACPSLDANGNQKTLENIVSDIFERTNLKISVLDGVLTLEDEAVWIEEQKLVAAEKTTLPQNKVAVNNYTKTWNSIRNFYFPNTYYSAGRFSTTADNAHHIKIYAMDGTYVATVQAELKNGRYVTNTDIKEGDYYAVIFNDSDSLTTNASFKAE